MVDAVRHGFPTPAGRTPRALVVGDLILDRYLWGEVERISPEAPVPVVRLGRETVRLGGAGNVAANLAGLGLRVDLYGHVGEDFDGRALATELAAAGIAADGLLRGPRPTISKTRVIGSHQQMIRLDREETGAFPAVEQARLLDAVRAALAADVPDVVILSDYAKGCLPAEVCQAVIAMARGAGVPVLVDPKGSDYRKYRGATGLTPNKREAAEATGVSVRDTEALLAGVAGLVRDLGLDFVALTRGEEGLSLVRAGSQVHLPARARQVFDVSGAGDTVIASLAAGLAAGLGLEEAGVLANLAAGIVVGKVGTVPVEAWELAREMERQGGISQADKICDWTRARAQVEAWHRDGRRVVFTNGCFDLLHAGHVGYLEQARKLGDRLVVGLNTDASVSRLKGPARPVIHEADRARVLAALEAVDAVVLFGEETPLDLILALRPDVLVKGDDYREDQVVGAAEVKSWGGSVALIPVLAGRSTTGIIAKLG
ncbi:D-glycero-beta-D-manno-heptose-7-phosphate kinase [Parasulfuritortus cantonensis]|uniref:Bifunctional protein HldE n=1 Tax=Parasulfuritortus cantonensis TaxID=2528202 RepID=A0A4R1BEB6_9PROT|nr:D-glycero-beta-D-manno-heptose-7-phosphate kinase [Parasulfuritortus cantonensis]TCJ15450.1 D-glycero-beta-D-manno-heptose-7-phosphate kinase [Parasulfuritortus cantonensis]